MSEVETEAIAAAPTYMRDASLTELHAVPMGENTAHTSYHYMRADLLSAVVFTLVSLEEVSGAKHGTHKLHLQDTIFHPQGGGQPSDIGNTVICIASDYIAQPDTHQ